MSTLVDEAIQLCRAEELTLTHTIRQCKDMLGSMRRRVRDRSEAETPTSVADTDISLKERQEVELLEQVLKKALKVRSSSEVSSNCREKPSSGGRASNAPAGKDSIKRNTPKVISSSSEVKESHQHAGQLKNPAGHGAVPARPVLFKTGPSFRPTTKAKKSSVKPFLTQKTTGRDIPIKPCQVTSCSLESEERTSHSYQEFKAQSEASAPKEQWESSPSVPLWQAQRAKKNRLWNKVLSRHCKPVPERDHFKKRLVSTFPTEWAFVHMAAMEAELDVLTQLGLDLTHCYNAELQRHQLGWSPEPSTEKEYESVLMLAGLEKMMIQVIKEADHLKKAWEKKMAWWHGALCPLRSRVQWCDSEQPCLPSVLTYSSKGELEDLHSLRLQVAQLKLEIHMHQAMCDALTDLISCESFSSGHPSASVLRGVYSLLGEGGAQFPSLVLDNDSAQT